MPRTVLFCFAGREPNLAVALPFYRRILDENPDVELHLWDLCRTPEDSEYLKTISGDRIQVRTDFAGTPGGGAWNAVWNHYARPEYSGTIFVKADDDVIFWETAGFAGFVQAALDNPDHVVSALTVNNGASTPHIPAIMEGFEELNFPLLDVHLHANYAEMCHRWFINNWQTLIGQPAELIPSDDWLSINCLAITHNVLRRIVKLLGQPSPPVIAGRAFPRRNARGRMSGHRIGDEGAANMLERLIYRGMAVAHWSFGPQEPLPDLRPEYAAIAKEYLA